jgi:hypothetical protein
MINPNYLDSIKKAFEKKEQKIQSDAFYSPSLKDSKNGTTYLSLIRFIPYLPDPSKSSFTRREYFINDPVTGKLYVLDAPDMLGEKNLLYFIAILLKNKKDAYYDELSKKFYSKLRYFSPVQVIKDENKPDVVGKILWFSYKTTIYSKIENQLNGENGLTDAHNPFDIVDGKRFALIIKKRGEYPYYDESRFLNDRDGIIINGVSYKEISSEVEEFLLKNTPSFDLIAPRRWGENEIRLILNYTKLTIGKDALYHEIIEKFLKATSPSECSYYKTLETIYNQLEYTSKPAVPEITQSFKQTNTLNVEDDTTIETNEIEDIDEDDLDKLLN